jgi:hypothetical protein
LRRLAVQGSLLRQARFVFLRQLRQQALERRAWGEFARLVGGQYLQPEAVGLELLGKQGSIQRLVGVPAPDEADGRDRFGR